ncbi:TPA: type VI secretion system baseplate subunit TssF [Pseudomonas aeruginosa]|nr:type VI secretion system baseplate subunit TssF [Pseudomonas aeruginosa]
MPLRTKFREEMEFLQRTGREFATDNPQLARFLGEEANDPDVERLLEGVAFLTAKMSLKIEDDLPELTHSLLNLLWPNYLRPLPSMTMIRFEPVEAELTERKVLPKDMTLLSHPVDGVNCQFRTCRDIAIYPLKMGDVTAAHSQEKSIVRIDLHPTSPNIGLDDIDCDELEFHLSGSDTTAQTLYLWLARYLDSVRVEINGSVRRIRPDQLTFPGFSPEEALLPYPQNVFDGYRILQEYFVFPQRFHFFSLTGLRSVWPSNKTDCVRLEFHFSRPMPMDTRISREDFSLYCTPAVNLFPHGAEPISLDGRSIDQRLSPAGRRPDAYEIFSVDEVNGWEQTAEGRRGRRLRDFHSFESLQHEIEHDQGRTSLYYRTRIEQAHGMDGIVHRIAFVRGDDVNYIGQNETVSVSLTCTNRELPTALGIGDVCLGSESTSTFYTFRNISVPTRPHRPILDGELQWTLISNLSLNYLSLLSIEPLKAVIRAYDFAALHDLRHARASRKRLDAIQDARTAPVDRFMRGLPVRGMQTCLRLDQSGFLCEGDLFLFCTVLSHFFALYASINSFHILEAVNTRNNETYSWPMKIGSQPLI